MESSLQMATIQEPAGRRHGQNRMWKIEPSGKRKLISRFPVADDALLEMVQTGFSWGSRHKGHSLRGPF